MRHRPLTSGLDLRRAATLAAPETLVPLRYRNRLQLFVDASYTSGMTLVPACQFTASSAQYLSAAHAASLDFSSGTNANTFSIEIWRNTGKTSDNRCYVSKDIFNTSGKRGWAVRGYGTMGQEHQVEFWAYNSAASAYGAVVTTNAPLNWSHCVLAVNLATATASFYFDGLTTPAATTALSGTLGALPTGQDAPLLMGAWNFGSSGGIINYYDGSLARIRLWRKVVAAVNIPALFNGGFPLLTTELLAGLKTNLVAAWDLSEESGTRSDATANANHLSEQHGALAQSLLCASLAERSGNAFQFRAPRLNYAPNWVRQSPINSRPALYFAGQHWMRAAAPGFGSTSVAGDIFTVFRPTDLSLTNFDYALITADKETYDGNYCYMFPLIYNTRLGIRMRRDKATSINNDPRGTLVLATGNNYVANQRGYGTGGASSFAYRVNGAANPLDTTYHGLDANSGNIHNQWYASLDSIDSLVLGGLNYDFGTPAEGPYAIQDRFQGYLAAVLVYGGTTVGGSLLDAENLAVEAWALDLANA